MALQTYIATVRVSRRDGRVMVVWAQVAAQNPNVARAQLEAQYGRGNVVSVPRLVS